MLSLWVVTTLWNVEDYNIVYQSEILYDYKRNTFLIVKKKYNDDNNNKYATWCFIWKQVER